MHCVQKCESWQPAEKTNRVQLKHVTFKHWPDWLILPSSALAARWSWKLLRIITQGITLSCSNRLDTPSRRRRQNSTFSDKFPLASEAIMSTASSEKIYNSIFLVEIAGTRVWGWWTFYCRSLACLFKVQSYVVEYWHWLFKLIGNWKMFKSVFFILTRQQMNWGV